MKQIALSIGILLGFLITIASTPATAGGFGMASVQYHSGTGHVAAGNPVAVRHYPNGRVEVIAIPVTHVYPAGVSLVHQNGGDRVYSTGYGGAATCYVDCWHGGVSPNSGSGSHFSIGIGAHKTW